MDGIAIIGMAGRFPGAPDVASFWRNLKDGVDSISRFSPAELEIGGEDDALEPGHVGARGILEDIDQFDARFFGFLPPEAELMDPQQRVFLELAWQAIEHAGYDAQRYDGPIGVFAGCFMNTYLLANLCSREGFLARLVKSIQTDAIDIELGNEKDHIATHTAYRIGLRGPAMTLQTACSTSLVATATACQSLLTRECDMALAGGVTIVVPQKRGYLHKVGSILSVDGVCRPFDAAASGTVFSNGAGVVLLKRLADAVADGDTIYAVIRGYALNNDGKRKVNYTAPSVAGQAEVISRALEMAGVNARSIGYVEAHGTATPVGDPIEVSGLTTAYAAATSDTGFCALGSVKANIGHLDVAAGVAGLIKVALSVHEGVIPPLVHFTSPNPKIDFPSTPFFVNTELRKWDTDDAPRRAAISSFGLGGTNAHLIVEQAPSPEARAGLLRSQHLFLLSARSPAALATQGERLAAHLETVPDQDLADVAFTLQAGRRQFDQRRFVVGRDRAELVARLRGPAQAGEAGAVGALNPPVVFMFPGQGAQYPGMGHDLYREEPVFREVVDRCAEALLADPEAGFDLREFLLWTPVSPQPAAEISLAMSQTRIAQPTIFTLEIALGRLLLAWGVRPTALVGHSVGEFAAACLAGVFDLEDAVRLVATRGRLMQALPPGQMLAVRTGAEVIAPMLPAGVSIAAINAPELTVVSGAAEDVAAFAGRAEGKGLQVTELKTSHAFHSAMMAPILEPLRAAVGQARRGAPAFEVHSTALAKPLAAEELCDPAYWAQQVMEPVRFSEAVVGAAGNGRRVFLEVGPRQSLSTFCRQTLGKEKSLAIVPCLGQGDAGPSESEQIMGAIGRLWVAGVATDWEALQGRGSRRVSLPTYPFERKHFWLDGGSFRPMPGSAASRVAVAATAPRAEDDEAQAIQADPSAPRTDAERLLAEIWSRLLGVENIGVNDNFFDLGGHSLLVATAVAEIRTQTGAKVSPNQFAFETLGQLAASLNLDATAKGGAKGSGLLGRIFGKRPGT